MKRVFGLSRLSLVGIVLVTAFLTMAGEAAAVTLNVCVPEKEGTAIVTPKAGVCEAKYNPSRLLPQGEAEKLENLLPYIKYEEKGVDGKPTIKFEGVNVQIVSGAGTEAAAVNGEGNIVIGYNESPGTQTGSNNLILGGEQTYTSYGGILGGSRNTISGPFSAVISGGLNVASGGESSVSGGQSNTASGNASTVGGGFENTASALNTSVSGGYANTASQFDSSVSGGHENTANSVGSSVSGGVKNTASGEDSSVSGGESNKAKGEMTWVGGGYKNVAEGELSAIFGGKEEKTTKAYEAIP
jgi:hypothetical protein